MVKTRNFYNRVALFLTSFLTAMLFLVCFDVFSFKASATDTLTGELDIYFNSGTLYTTYEGDLTLSSGATYKWFLSGTQKSTGTSYTPTEAGSYYVTLTDSAYSGTIYSDTITLYKVTIGTTGISLDSSNGIYEAGDEVTARATLTGTQTVTNWTSTVAGLALPSSGSPITFKMPSTNLTLSCTISNVYTVYIYGGTADSYSAKVGDLITITADTMSGKTFEKWVTSGASVTNAEEPVTQFTMPAANVTIRATFVEDTDDDSTGNTATFTDPTRTLYTVTRSNNYKVDMYHHDQGPECVRSFIFGAGTDYLVTSYWNIVINDNFNIRETPGPITICLTLPADLQKSDRNWRMICVSRDGLVYSFADEDDAPETITFSPDRFYAFALCFNDTPEVVEADGDAEVITVTDGDDSTDTTTITDDTSSPIQTSTLHSVSESQTNTTTQGSNTITGSDGQTSVESEKQSVESDKTDAINSSGTTQIPIVSVFDE